ncbi:MAG: tetratricopeptide repeat protein [Candidatus Omnitrophica bacterium]|nr:tetratricopeptide repeat protein [Candidatus Omnitrophota bacterium]
MWPRAMLIFLGVAIISTFAFAEEKLVVDKAEVEQFDFANGLLSRGMFDMASGEYETFIKEYPKSELIEDASIRCAEAYFYDGDNEKAILKLRAFKNDFPNSSLLKSASFRLAQALFISEDLKNARSELDLLYKSLEKTDELLGGIIYYLAEIEFKEGKTADAIKNFNELIALGTQGEYLQFAYTTLARAYTIQGEKDNAIEAYRKVILIAENEKIKNKALIDLAELLSDKGEVDEARKIYSGLLERVQFDEISENALLDFIHLEYKQNSAEQTESLYKKYFDKVQNVIVKSKIHFILGNTLYKQNKFDEAFDEFKNVVDMADDEEIKERSYANMLWSLYESGKYEKLFSLEKERGEINGTPEILFIRARAFDKTSDTENAVKTFETIIADHKDSSFYKDSLYELASIYDKNNDTVNASRVLNTFINAYPDDERINFSLIMLGRNNIKSGDLETAEKAYIKFLESKKEDTNKELVQFELGNIYIKQKDYTKLIPLYESFALMYSSSVRLPFVKYWLAKSYKAIGETGKALECFKTISESDSEYAPKALETIGYMHFENKEYDLAASEYLELMKKFPEYLLPEKVYLWAAEHYFDKEAATDSQFILEQLANKYPDSIAGTVSLYMMSENNRKLGNALEAITSLKELLSKDIQHPYLEKASLSLGKSYLFLNNHDFAIRAFEKALADSASNAVSAEARMGIGEAKSKKGDYIEAAKSYLMVAILFQDSLMEEEALFKAAKSYENAGNREKAVEIYKELEGKFPDGKYKTTQKEQI